MGTAQSPITPATFSAGATPLSAFHRLLMTQDRPRRSEQ